MPSESIITTDSCTCYHHQERQESDVATQYLITGVVVQFLLILMANNMEVQHNVSHRLINQVLPCWLCSPLTAMTSESTKRSVGERAWRAGSRLSSSRRAQQRRKRISSFRLRRHGCRAKALGISSRLGKGGGKGKSK